MSATVPPARAGRLHALDALRGVAALTVVILHWQHFNALGGVQLPDRYPRGQFFFWLLQPFYDNAWMAVNVFFVLSGYVFYWLYSGKIASGKLGGGVFLLLRFSRLYPLHFATLILMAAMEAVFRARTGHYFIYESGDAGRFAAALLMAQQWLPPATTEYFNGPAWSVSVEVLLYILFFWACRFGLTGPRAALAVALTGLLVLPFSDHVARGLIGFFSGGAVWHACEAVKQRPGVARIARLLGWLALAGWIAALAEYHLGVVRGGLHALTGLVSPRLQHIFLARPNYFMAQPFILLAGPLTVAALALQEQVLDRRYAVLNVLGDISYSVYLLHVPLQLICALAAPALGWTTDTFMTPLAVLQFCAVLLALSTVSHYGFERPLQQLIRRGARHFTASPDGSVAR